MDAQFVTTHDLTKCTFELQASCNHVLHRIVEYFESGSSAFLCSIHGRVCVLQEHLSCLIATACKGNTHACGDKEFTFVANEWSSKGVEDAACNLDCATYIFDVLTKDGKLVSAEAGDIIVFTNCCSESSCRVEQKLVSGRMTERIIHMFESIEINEEHG